MSDIFLSYASDDVERVRPLVHALERHGWTVWWDRTSIPVGQTFDQVIETALDAARCVIVVWSSASVQSDWVKAEAEDSRQRGILIPVAIETELRLPLSFRFIQTAQLAGWQGDESHDEFRKVVTAVTEHIGPPAAAESEGEPVEPPDETQSAVLLPGDELPEAGPLEVEPKAPQKEPSVQGESPPGEPVRPAPTIQPGSQKRFFIGGGVLVALMVVAWFVTRIVSRNNGSLGPEITPPVTPSLGTTPPSKPASPPVSPPSETTLPSIWRNSLGMEFALMRAGTFRMGSTNGDSDEKPVHEVTISQPFYLSKYEVTQGQWEKVTGTNPSRFTGDSTRPVERVSWEDVQQFIEKLNARERETGVTYRLPTEAEWEYAARAGTTMAYSFGDDASQLGAYAWYNENSSQTTHPVGQKQPNPWGLYDMHGNVWEWVHDWYDTYSAEAVTDPQGPDTGSARVVRGGGWFNDAGGCRSAYRLNAGPGFRYVYLGFRLLRQVR